MVKTQHGGNEESHGGIFSRLFNTDSHNNNNSHGLVKSSSHGFLSGLFGNNQHTPHTDQHTSHGLTFQKIVSYIAAIILAGTLTVIGFTIYHSKSTTKYPPEISECPDYWESVGPNKCRNTLNVGKCPNDDVVDFNQPKYSGPTGLAEKCKWASNCGLVWDGLKC
jgi:hypothetical protein